MAPETPPRPDRRQALIGAAYQRIANDGFEGLRTRDVAADVGVNIATLHYYFPTKEALIRGVIGYAMQHFTQTMPGEGSPSDQLRGHLRAIATLLKQDQQLWTVMGELVLRAPRDADLARIFQQTDDYWHRALSQLIQRCMAEASIDPELDPDDVATLIIMAIKGVSLPTMAGSRTERADQVFREINRVLGWPETAGRPTPTGATTPMPSINTSSSKKEPRSVSHSPTRPIVGGASRKAE